MRRPPELVLDHFTGRKTATKNAKIERLGAAYRQWEKISFTSTTHTHIKVDENGA